MRRLPLYRLIAQTVEAHDNCAKSGNLELKIRHRETLNYLERNLLPSGSGIDNGTRIDFDRTTPDRLVFYLDFHHMNDGGFYDGWTEHRLTVKASLTNGIDIHISGRDRNAIKDYLYEVYDCALREFVEWDNERERWQFAPEPASVSTLPDAAPVNTADAGQAFGTKG